MAESIKCPICGKDDIHNFHTEDVVCPCCGSDLSIYHKLYCLSSAKTINNRAAQRNRWVVPMLTASTVLFAVGCLFFAFPEGRILPVESNQMTESSPFVDKLNDSIVALNKTVTSLRAFNSKQPQNSILTDELKVYIVKKGDSFCKISKKLYGTELRYSEIVKLNNLNATFVLHKGDSLKVSIK